MIDGLKPYPAMKDSGVPWLGEVPGHWGVLPNRAIFDEVKERDRADADMLSVTITKGVIRQQTLLEDSSKKDSSKLDRSAYKLVRPGDIAYNKMRAWQGAVGVSEYEGIVSPAYVVQRPRGGAASRYVHYLLRTPAFAKEAERWSYGITSDMWSLRPEHFKMIYSCLPPLPEQAAIVRFLDHADRRIRRYIRAKQKLIKLLEEQKQAIIHRAVTRGLDPNVRLKPSGVEWLGDVPEHWEVRRVKSLSLVKRGASPRPIADPKYFDDAGEYAWVRIADVSASTRYLETTTQRLSSLGDSLSVRLEPGALFLSIAGSVGKPIITKIKCCIHDGFVYFPQFHGNVEFLCRIFSCGAPFGRLGKLGTQLNLNTDTVGGICVGWPPITEQAAIVTYLDEATASFERVIASARREIDLLREYRTRLIADVVTGKLDVREAAVRLPDEVEEAEPLDEIDAEGDSDEAGSDDADAVPEEVEA
ncbi:MAG: restriction endonuclease subunit S [Gammaproteobacteria bacterium]|nr:restriction endonuclease subunit S [Gammaproteobacteria bacterium]